jgi:peptidoglycan hydrolase-like protein with peptidoglycan-binding domain
VVVVVRPRIRRFPLLLLALVLTAGLASTPPARAGGLDWVVVERGDTGLNVRAAQALLRDHGYRDTFDGTFGPSTVSAVRAFQQDQGLRQTGRVGTATWPRLVHAVQLGDEGQTVRVIERKLAKLYDLAVDGKFGPKTEAVVKRFQKDSDLHVDGVVGKFTWKHLIAIQGPACLRGRC